MVRVAHCRRAVLAGLGALALAACAAPESRRIDVAVATGSEQGVYRRLGEALIAVWGAELGVRGRVLGSDGSLADVERLRTGAAPVAFCVVDVAVDALADRSRPPPTTRSPTGTGTTTSRRARIRGSRPPGAVPDAAHRGGQVGVSERGAQGPHVDVERPVGAARRDPGPRSAAPASSGARCCRGVRGGRRLRRDVPAAHRGGHLAGAPVAPVRHLPGAGRPPDGGAVRRLLRWGS